MATTSSWRNAAVWSIIGRHCSMQQAHQCSRQFTTDTTHPRSASSIYEDDQLGIRAEDLPLPVWQTMQQLRAAGHTVLLVGGAVRDLLLGNQTPKDWDLLTSAHLTEVKHLLPKPRIFGRTVPICQLDVDGVRIEISSMHTRPPIRVPVTAAAAAAAAGDAAVAGVPPDASQILQAGPRAAVAAAAAAAAAAGGQIGRHRRGKPSHTHRPQQQQLHQHHHHQQQQQQLSWAAVRRENALGRDFTVNCLQHDPFAGLLFDYAGGVRDLMARVLRCNGDADARFSRDPACMLRAVRCAARAGLQVDPATLTALQQHSHLISSLNSHRLTAELLAMLGYGAAALSLHLLEQTQLLQHLLPTHAAYMRRQHQQQQQQLSLSRRAASQHCTNTDSSSSHRNTCCEDLQCQQLPQLDSQQQAYSALGQLWSQLHQGSQQQQQRVPSQGQQQVLQQQHQQLQDANILLQVLAALDQQVSVSQPAPAEVVLACLTAPLLVEALTAAVEQVQVHTQETHQLAALQEAQHHLARAEQQQQQQHDARQLPGFHQQTAAEAMALLLQPLPAAARSIARPFSSSSGSSSTSWLAQPSSGEGALPGPGVGDLVQQLLQGVPAEDCVQQYTMHIAAQVCRQPAPDDQQQPEQEQQGYQAAGCSSPQLFGVHAPKQVAELLAACLQPPSEPQAQTVGGPRAAVQRDAPSGSRSSSSSRPQLDLWDEYAAALPRTNKQFRQLMQRQLQGSPGTLATDAGLLVEASAPAAQAGWEGSSSSIDGERACTSAATNQQLVSNILEASGVLQQLQQLQGAFVRLIRA